MSTCVAAQMPKGKTITFYRWTWTVWPTIKLHEIFTTDPPKSAGERKTYEPLHDRDPGEEPEFSARV